MEYEFSTNGLTKNSSDMLSILYKKRKALMGLLNNSTNEKGKKNTGFNVQSCVSLEFISTLFLNIFSKDVPKNEISAPARELRTDIDLIQFIVASTCNSLRSVSSYST